MMTLALSGLEKALNGYIRLDPDTVQQLSNLENKRIKIQISDWNIEFFIIPHKNGVQLSTSTNAEADTIISGSLFGLCRAGCAKGESSALFKNSIEISGDTEVGEKVRSIMANMDIDWEEHLSKMTGDIIAHQIGAGVRRTINFGKSAATLIRENLKDYLQAESQLVPTMDEVNSFIKSVTHLHYAVERAEIRIQRLLSKRKSSA
ncbi:ubiquinone biosynthesis accessory factor UbiJ [Coxiella burnetii]|uniref:ubiquinone biosynthesis accessory factor UbiJ n=1 Tax=Coxiella burnetii TaxID=777 RepID=UPI000183CEB9|nr:SCP2 sterol-binding domain-containing protein [Coxiella burnetii]ACJ19269.1 hypothetical protein CbuG_2027 [Coxiella burnetii CbuG_Q212]ATN67592.1 hypothetical protein AYM17_09965 [Coxiella burnetii]OYK85337.1 hypothetical protein CbuQ229_10350 [Coxiella burnetii]